jgi:hypothetical protein
MRAFGQLTFKNQQNFENKDIFPFNFRQNQIRTSQYIEQNESIQLIFIIASSL